MIYSPNIVTNKFIFVNFYRVHTVFGEVVNGHDTVRQIENLAVDRNSRPLQDAVVINCGELVRQIKGKFYCNYF